MPSETSGSPLEGRVAEMSFEVPGLPIPKIRMTRRDKWIMRRPRTAKDLARVDTLKRYWSWVEAVRLCFLGASRGRMRFALCRMGFKFFVSGHPVLDLDNLIKGVKDALKGSAFEDDNALVVQGYYDDPEVLFLCDSCDQRGVYARGEKKGQTKPDCGAVDRCKLPRSVVKIKGLLVG